MCSSVSALLRLQSRTNRNLKMYSNHAESPEGHLNPVWSAAKAATTNRWQAIKIVLQNAFREFAD
ncbi:hypothetical protein CCR75_007104 [Bremia lactucae]|uniref:Uncharacterized protein n=1 Tax=Bremia lactucae TaxID=4779 RepID=A0A976FQ74_BRELC|nr:hypothetical protein CCR75_007104 [Bremia lactucae]